MADALDISSLRWSAALLLLWSGAIPVVVRFLPRSPAGRRVVRRVSYPATAALLVTDVFIGSEIALGAALAGACFVEPVLTVLASTACLVFAHAVIIVDHLIQREAGIRFSWHFLSFFGVIGCFKGSIRRGGVGWTVLIGIIAAYTAIIASALWWTITNWGRVPIDTVTVGVVVALGVATVIIQRLIHPSVVWEQQSIWLQFQRLWLGMRPNSAAATDLAPAEFLQRISPRERYTLLDAARPLYRLTHGYQGPRRFELDLRGERPHFIVLFLESFCASTIGGLGNDVGASPEFDRIAREGVLFRNFYANGVQTARAVVAGLFGIPPRFSECPVQADPRGCPRLIGLPDLFLALGYHTAYLHNGSLAFEQADVFMRGHGFRELAGADDLMARFPEAKIEGGWGVPDEFLMRHCADWVARQENLRQPGFATLFTMTNHHPFEVPAGFATPAFHFPGNPEKEMFLRTFYYSDHCLGLLLRLLRERGLEQKCVFFILGDTAQPLGEHDSWAVQTGLFEENLKIPLLIHAPGYLRAPAVIDEPASQVDLLPTCLDLFGEPFAHHAVGTSLIRPSGTRPVWFNTPFGPGCIGERRGSLKLIHESRTGTTRLFDLSADPAESNDLGPIIHPTTGEMKTDLLATHALLQELYRTDRFC
ncbi:MAG TPA: sulfatase-like hydrolase/transferase [Verrucomicrobiota bacterium]|nr:sulfatase-like hydrolase/transferase [Verrucomicrobiota bacterium]